jgi:hypothetical protein
VLIAGNHDLARVGELAPFDEETWLRVRAEADAVARSGGARGPSEEAFLARHPELPSAEVASRDFATFDVVQRDQVRSLLRRSRFRLAHAPKEDLLLTHAGVTIDDLRSAGVKRTEADAFVLSAALNEVFDTAVREWLRGDSVKPLELPGLHHPGSAAYGEARGILYHRPANPKAEAQPGLFAGPLQRRFDPRRLPTGLVQAIGHIRDGKCRTLLGPWADGEVAQDGPLRHLCADDETVRYGRGVVARAGQNDAVMLFLDGGLFHADVESYELLDLTSRQALARPG